MLASKSNDRRSSIVLDPHLEIRHLRYFVTVAETLHFGKAAKALHISQPPLSRQVRDLERWVGVTLLERSPKSISLTEAGAVFLQEAKRILGDLQFSVHMAHRAAAGEMGTLALAYDRFFDSELLAELRQTFSRHFPEVRVTFHRVDSEDQSALIRGGSLDAGFLMLPVSDGDHLTREPLFREPVLAVAHVSHPIAWRDEVSVRDLAPFPFLELRRNLDEPVYGHAGRIGTMCGVSLHVEGACDSLERLPQTLRESRALAFLPAGARDLCGESLRCFSVLDQAADFTFGLIYDRSRVSCALTRFIETSRQLARRWNEMPARKESAEMAAA